jgi:aspartate carbamoyltransferase catalytic subunit
MTHIVKTQSFTLDFLDKMFKSSVEMRNLCHKRTRGDIYLLNGMIVATFFAEESTRTRLSFESAALKLGAKVISSANARQFSSVSKGEILEDTIRVLDRYADCIVIRYHEEGGAARAAHVSRVPIINGGDGTGQHPTQALLDLFTIKDELGQIGGLKVALVGDLKNGRTVHSLTYLLGKFNDITLYLVSPDSLMMPQNIVDYLSRHNVEVIYVDELESIIGDIDVLYQTRVQRERFESLEDYERSEGNLIVTRDLANRMKMDAIIMHPLPRINEIRYGVDDNHRAKYFTQAENGLYVRMALLNYVILGEE